MRVVSYTIIAILLITYFTINMRSTGNDLIDYPLRNIYHADLYHLLANSVSFFALSFMEEIIGWQKFLFAIIFIWVLSSVILYAIHALFPSRKVVTVGFSGVIFGLAVIYYTLLGQSTYVNAIGLFASIVPQLMVPGISFEGHLSGIIAGFIYVWLFPVDKYKIK